MAQEHPDRLDEHLIEEIEDPDGLLRGALLCLGSVLLLTLILFGLTTWVCL